MNRKDTLVLGVLYPGMENFFDDYLTSLFAQESQEFDILLLNDGSDVVNLNHDKINTISLPQGLSFGAIRQIAFRYALDYDYNFLIFTDTDDFFSKNRIHRTKDFLQKYDFIFNELTTVNSKGEILEKGILSNFNIPIIIDKWHLLSERNYIGLSSSAVNTRILKNIVIPDNILAVDWFLYTELLIHGYKGYFDCQVNTFYRQHDNNIVGINTPLNEKSLEKKINIIENHYFALNVFSKGNHNNEITIFTEEKLNKLSELKSWLSTTENKTNYINIVNSFADEIVNGWYSEIITLEKFEYYEKRFFSKNN